MIDDYGYVGNNINGVKELTDTALHYLVRHIDTIQTLVVWKKKKNQCTNQINQMCLLKIFYFNNWMNTTVYFHCSIFTLELDAMS